MQRIEEVSVSGGDVRGGRDHDDADDEMHVQVLSPPGEGKKIELLVAHHRTSRFTGGKINSAPRDDILPSC